MSSGRPTLVLVHGLWHSSSSWGDWVDHAATHDVAAVAVDWPAETDGVMDVSQPPPGFSEIVETVQSRVAQTADPVVVGAGAGALVAEAVADRLSPRAVVCIAPLSLGDFAQTDTGGQPGQLFAGPIPRAWDPTIIDRWVALDAAEYAAYMGTNIPRDESDALWRRWAVPTSGRLLSQLRAPELTRGPIPSRATRGGRIPRLHVTGSSGATGVGSAGSADQIRASYSQSSSTRHQVIELPDRGQTLVVDAGWREVADLVLGWLTAET